MATQQSSASNDLNQFIKQYPLNQRIPLIALKKLVTERQLIDNEQEQSIAKIKISYQEKLKPLLQRASEIIQGSAIKQDQIPPTAITEYFAGKAESVKNHLKGKVIDGYWNGVLSNSPLVDDITENDEKALNYLLDIQVLYPQNLQDNGSISLKFVFKPNPYFKETTLVRHLRVKNGQMLAIEGDVPTFTQFLTHETKKVVNKKTLETRLQKGKKIKSFFDLFLDWNIDNQGELTRAGNFIIELGNMIVIDSLDYFLGLINCDDGNSENSQQDQEDQDEEEQQVGQKKIKQN